MIHVRATLQIAPGRQADAVARAHEWMAIYKKASGVDARISVVTNGTLGRLCISSDHEGMGAMEASDAKAEAHPDWKALGAKHGQEHRDGTSMYVPNTRHDEIWRDA